MMTRWCALVGLVVLAGCSSSSSGKSDADYQADVVSGMHDSLATDLDDLVAASTDLQNAAPTPAGRGWDAAQDAAAIAAMKAAWIRARTAYEHIEGAIAPIFPDIDASIDARYDDFMASLGPTGDANLFDDQGVTGLHAVERIMWADATPASVVTFEKALPGYKAAAFPASEKEAADFKALLCAKVVTDAKTLHDQWQPAKIDIAIAFQGLISLMNEQREKVTKASTNEEESRYSQRTMADIRDNLDGTQKIYALFETWLVTKSPDTDQKLWAGFQTLHGVYASVQGDAIPQPPATWSAETPSAADLQTPFGQLYSKVKSAVDPNTDGSIVFEMNAAAGLLGFPRFQEK
jgi:iron uptake system component EfeO